MQAVTSVDMSNDAFPFLTAREITVGSVPVTALRVTYVGELGWELYAPTEYGRALWATLWDAGRPHGLVPLGLDALDVVRIEAGLVFAGYEFDDQVDPFEAGIGFTVPLKTKEDDFSGRDALLRRKAAEFLKS